MAAAQKRVAPPDKPADRQAAAGRPVGDSGVSFGTHDLLDPDRADAIDGLVRARLGDTLIRIGRPPKRMLLYRTGVPFPKMSVGDVEVLGEGQQLVAFGVHPDTGQPYHWPAGSPLELPLAWLPPVDRETCARLLRDVAALLPADECPARARVR